MAYFSQFKGRPVFDSKKEKIGILKDLIFIDGEEYAKVTHLVYISEDKYRKKISWELVGELKERKVKSRIEIDIFLNTTSDEVSPFFEQKTEMYVGNIMDKQIVDVNGLKVVRVNDILLRKIEDKFCITAVCVGTKSLFRRLGMGGFLGSKKTEEQLIPWESVEPLEKNLHDIHVKVQRNKIADLHPEDIADIMEDLDYNERAIIFNSLDQKTAAKTLIESEPSVQNVFFRNLKIKKIVSLLENIPIHHAADIISLMPKTKRSDILSMMNEENAAKIREIIKYPEESAGAIMHTDFIQIPVNYTTQKTINLLRKLKPTHEYHIYIVDNKKHLLGVLSVRALLTSSPKTLVSEIMLKNIVKIKTATPKEDIAKLVAKYDLLVLPVVDENNVLKGVVSADEVLTNIMPKSWRKRKLTKKYMEKQLRYRNHKK